MSHPLLLAGAVIVMAWCFARLEIEIEGPDGWAASLPTWRVEGHPLVRLLMGGRPLTGYHLYALLFAALVFHFPAALFATWSWRLEARALAALIAFWIIEDLLWFLMNPAWGLRRFNRGQVSWHPHWVLGAPREYWTFGLAAAALGWWSFAG
jgi:hypothetical protein